MQMLESGEFTCCICKNITFAPSNKNFERRLSDWLDENPAFTWRYFNQKAIIPPKDDDSSPLTKNNTNETETTQFANEINRLYIGESFERLSSQSHLRNQQNVSDETQTGLRKISSQDLELPVFKRMVSQSLDGGLTFIPTDGLSPLSIHATKLSSDATPESPLAVIHQSSIREPSVDERELINELVFDICQELDITALCFKILQNVCLLIGADRGSLFLVDRDPNSGKDILVSKLFDVTSECSMAESLTYSDKRRITIPFGVGISGFVAETGEHANISDAYSDPRFSDSVDRETGFKTKCILCMPIKNVVGKVLAVALIMNKRSVQTKFIDEGADSHRCGETSPTEVDQVFTDRDVGVFKSYVAFCGIGLHNAQIYQNSRMETYRNQVLLELARIIFTEQKDVSRLIYTILSHTISLLQCQRCQLLLVQEELTHDHTALGPVSSKFSHAYNMTWHNARDCDLFLKRSHSIESSEYPVQLELAVTVVQTGEAINLTNPHEDSRFNSSLENERDPVWCTKAVLCVPVKTSDGHVLGVCFLFNKLTGDARFTKRLLPSQPADDKPATYSGGGILMLDNADWSGNFSMADQCLFEAFGLFAGLGIVSRQMYEKVIHLVAKQRITLDVLAYHSTARKSEAKCLAKAMIPTTRFYHLDEFTFNDFKLSDEATLKACVRMFMEIDFLHSGAVDRLVFCQWLLSVKKNYRAVTYHNWRHALNVTQTMFATIKNTGLQTVFGKLECLALMVACISHDLDHRGTDNQFQVKTMSPLVELYSTSVLEHHHFNQFMIILTRKGNDFLSFLEACDYKLVINLIKEFILATDLSRFFTHLPQFKETLEKHIHGETKVTEVTLSSGYTSMEPWISDPDQRSLLACMLMTSSDLAAISKPWPIQKKVADLLTMEFFEQGDLEKDKFNIQPNELMDRTRVNDIPAMQVKFIDTICLPVYEAIVQVSSALQPLLSGCRRNRICWSLLSEGREVPQSLFGLTADSKHDNRADTASCSDSLESFHPKTLDIKQNRKFASATLRSLTSRRLSLCSAMSTVGGEVPNE